MNFGLSRPTEFGRFFFLSTVDRFFFIFKPLSQESKEYFLYFEIGKILQRAFASPLHLTFDEAEEIGNAVGVQSRRENYF